ncbi:MAG TPA: gluconokinase [Chloroflexota bacterium]
MAEHFVGVDVGTTGARAVVFDRDARPLAEATREYRLYTPRPSWAEQDALEVAETVVGCLRRAARKAGLSRREPVAIGLSGTFHSILPIGSDGQPSGRALIWADTRASAEAARIRAERDAMALYRRTGCPIHPMYLPAKLRWLRHERGEAAGYRSIKEYVLYRLTGLWAGDLSIASGTGLLSLARREWDPELLEIAGVRAEQLAPLVETTEVVGRLTPAAAAAAGLSPASEVVAGAGDGVLASLGAGAIEPGQMTATIGTSGATRIVTVEPRVDERQARTWCYYLAGGLWVAGAAINNAGIAFRWTGEKLLRTGARYERVLEWAQQVAPGAGGVLFLPFLTGERAPYWNADARGVLFGLAIDHDHRNVARATVEGVCYRMRSIYDAVAEVAGPVREVRVTGGFTRSPFWLQLLADVLEQPLRVPTVQEASAVGAAALAMVGVGALTGPAEAGRFASVGPAMAPDPGKREIYRRTFDLYMRTYWALQEQFRDVAAMQRG